MAFVGWISGVYPFTCGIRALVGAAAAYVLTKVVYRIVLKVMADAIIRGTSRDMGLRNDTHGRQ